MSKGGECFCGYPLDGNGCMVDCHGLHLMHYECLRKWLDLGTSVCPYDRVPISQCLHDGKVEQLPKVKPKPQEE